MFVTHREMSQSISTLHRHVTFTKRTQLQKQLNDESIDEKAKRNQPPLQNMQN